MRTHANNMPKQKILISIASILFVLSVGYNGWNFWQKQKSLYFQAGFNQAILNVVKQAETGQVIIGSGKNTIILIPK